MENNPFDSVCACASDDDIKPVFNGMFPASSYKVQHLKFKIRPFTGLHFIPQKKKLSKKDYKLINFNSLNNG